jgi:hypothetical protein
VKLRYARVYSDAEGASHLSDHEQELALIDYAPPAAPLNFAALGDAVGIAVVGADSTWGGHVLHPAPARQFMIVLSGQVQVTVSDGEVRKFDPGDVFLLEDTTGVGHSSSVLGQGLVAVVRLA